VKPTTRSRMGSIHSGRIAAKAIAAMPSTTTIDACPSAYSVARAIAWRCSCAKRDSRMACVVLAWTCECSCWVRCSLWPRGTTGAPAGTSTSAWLVVVVLVMSVIAAM